MRAVRDKRKSLFSPGILKVVGDFHSQDAVSLCDKNGREFGRGLANYNSEVRVCCLVGVGFGGSRGRLVTDLCAGYSRWVWMVGDVGRSSRLLEFLTSGVAMRDIVLACYHEGGTLTHLHLLHSLLIAPSPHAHPRAISNAHFPPPQEIRKVRGKSSAAFQAELGYSASEEVSWIGVGFHQEYHHAFGNNASRIPAGGATRCWD